LLQDEAPKSEVAGDVIVILDSAARRPDISSSGVWYAAGVGYHQSA